MPSEPPIADVAAPLVPTSLRLLAIAPREPSWVGLALALDAAGCESPRLCWQPSLREAAALLREEAFDVVVYADDDESGGRLEEQVAALLATAPDEALVVCRERADDELWTAAAESGFEPLIVGDPWSSVALLPTIRRALERRELERAHRRLSVERDRRLQRERREAEQILGQQQRILAGLASDFGLDSSASPSDVPDTHVHDDVRRFYQELLRTFVIMGSGRMSGEIAAFAETLAVAGMGPREALKLHLEGVDELVRGLGNRSTRHVLNRADLLALELVVQLGEHLHRAVQAATARDAA